MVSLTGTWMQTTAVTWLAYKITQQSKWPAMIAAASLLPTFLLGAWAGSLADRWPKRSLLCVTQSLLLLLAVLLAVLVYVGKVVPWQLLAITAGLSGVVVAIDFQARLAFVLDLVGGLREDLMNAVALNSVLFNAAQDESAPSLASMHDSVRCGHVLFAECTQLRRGGRGADAHGRSGSASAWRG